jgi:hypothetical protein
MPLTHQTYATAGSVFAHTPRRAFGKGKKVQSNTEQVFNLSKQSSVST